MSGNSTFLDCWHCGYETNQTEKKNTGVFVKTFCLICQKENDFLRCKDCGELYLVKKKHVCKPK